MEEKKLDLTRRHDSSIEITEAQATQEIPEVENTPEVKKAGAPQKTAAPKKAQKDTDSGKGKEKDKKKKKAKATESKPLKPFFRYANILYTAIVFGVIAIGLLVLPHSTVSEIEQRNLAEFPTFTPEEFVNGKYTNGITDYYNDTVPFRDDLKKVAANLRGFFGVSLNNAEIVGPVARVDENNEDEEEPAIVFTTPPETTPVSSASETKADVTQSSETTQMTTAPAETTTATTTTLSVEEKKNLNEIAPGVRTNGQVVTKLSDGHWWGISLYGGGKGTTYAQTLNAVKEQLGDDVNVYCMVVPTSGEYYLPDSYSQYNASHEKSIESIHSQLVGVIPVPAYKELWKHIDEPIYLRTDHHWQALGAYYAAKCLAETAGLPFADISTMERVDVPGYVGTMSGFTGSPNIQGDPEVFTYYKPSNSYKCYYYDISYNFNNVFPFFIKMPVGSSYSTFMASDDKIVHTVTDAGTGRKLVLFKDSYGNAEVPFYFGSFDEVICCDMRFFDLNPIQFCKEVGATDVLFTCCTFSAAGGNANTLAQKLNTPYTTIPAGVQ